MKAEMPEDMGPSSDGDNDAIIDQCAMECMNAIEKKDKEAFIEAFHVLVADLLSKLQPDQKPKE